MAIADRRKPSSDGKLWRLCPFWQSGAAASSSSSSSTQNLQTQRLRHQNGAVETNARPSNKVSSVARSLLPARRRLRLDPASNLYFPNEPGKQVKSAVRIKNTSRSHVAFKFMEHPENNEKQSDQKNKVKFKIMSLKVKAGLEYAPELFDEQKEEVTVERILRVVFLDVERPSPALEKLKRQLAEAEAALESRKKPPADTGPRVVGEGLVIDEWKERREKYLARQQVEAVDSV
ncbi:hypothetical protein RJ639_028209 [Escallonia herrerae]|uniref:MSP domain-containing protein n=1 Tax=Escallonia herrerae TaxID=1293975 RepID=A0AA88X831_9ASTE|nr:hypothetical protein RJ639_028209 [Escallonia herrerae]